MQLEQSFLKEIRYAQCLAYTSQILSLINIGIFLAMNWTHLSTLVSISSLVAFGFSLLFFALIWQLGKLREWARKILLALIFYSLLGSGADILQLTLFGPIHGSVLYRMYYYGYIVIKTLISVLTCYYLTSSPVLAAFQLQRLRTSAADIPRNH